MYICILLPTNTRAGPRPPRAALWDQAASEQKTPNTQAGLCPGRTQWPLCARPRAPRQRQSGSVGRGRGGRSVHPSRAAHTAAQQPPREMPRRKRAQRAAPACPPSLCPGAHGRRDGSFPWSPKWPEDRNGGAGPRSAHPGAPRSMAHINGNSHRPARGPGTCRESPCSRSRGLRAAEVKHEEPVQGIHGAASPGARPLSVEMGRGLREAWCRRKCQLARWQVSSDSPVGDSRGSSRWRAVRDPALSLLW